jgi:hypothetical protein
VHGLKVHFCSGVSSKESFKGLDAYDSVLIFGRSDEFYMRQLDQTLEFAGKNFYMSMVGKQYALKNIHVLSNNYSEVFEEIKF